MLLPISKMLERVELAREESDTALFFNILYLGEMLTKIVTLGLISAISDDRDKLRYSQTHRIVRADGIGEWGSVIDSTLAGPASHHLLIAAREEQKELMQKCSIGTWQYDAVESMHKCLSVLDSTYEELKPVIDGRKWFSYFAVLRNKTRGHGAPPSSICSKICIDLEKSCRIFIEHFILFKRSWAYLHHNLSGKYRVSKLTEDASPFNYLKSSREDNLQDGIYVFFERPALIELIKSDIDVSDFFFPNGGFNSKTFELLSYITGNKQDGDANLYMTPATELPNSETQGLGELEIQGDSFGNLPPLQKGYIKRETLENDLYRILINDRHPVVTLVGRGGIGKTSLAISVLYELAKTGHFSTILWFSARDIDLLTEGPKLVRPHVLSEKEIADEFVRLLGITPDKKKKSIDYFKEYLTSKTSGPLLLIFDNFETVKNPVELFNWLDTYIRMPNKILITTRFRDFKGDFPIEVPGMSATECEQLINSTSDALSIKSLLTKKYKEDLFRESDGHPYVIKILLGEVAKAGALVKVERIIATQETILEALFERTFSGLSPVAKRVFLTLCNWRTTLPQLALEAVLLRPGNDKMDVTKAIEELFRSSFVEYISSKEDDEIFLKVPLAATIFGERKLAVEPIKSAVEADTLILQFFGAAQPSDVRHGIGPRVNKLFRQIAIQVTRDNRNLEEHIPMMEFISQKYPPAWLLLARLYEEVNFENYVEKAKEAVRHYLESPYDLEKKEAWERLATLCKRTGDILGEMSALLEFCKLPEASFNLISDAASRLNALFKLSTGTFDSEEKQIIVRSLIQVMENRIEEADATDLSRLAWLYLNVHDEQKARQYTIQGNKLDSSNEYCIRLAEKFNLPLG